MQEPDSDAFFSYPSLPCFALHKRGANRDLGHPKSGLMQGTNPVHKYWQAQPYHPRDLKHLQYLTFYTFDIPTTLTTSRLLVPLLFYIGYHSRIR